MSRSKTSKRGRADVYLKGLRGLRKLLSPQRQLQPATAQQAFHTFGRGRSGRRLLQHSRLELVAPEDGLSSSGPGSTPV